MKIKLLKSTHEDGIIAEKLLKEAKVDFATILSCSDVDVPTLIVPGIAYPYKGLNQIKQYIKTHPL
jgi:hypothetical protein